MGQSGARRRVARAFAPAHITGLFVPELAARDPRARGSLGAGIVLDRGVRATATWDPTGPRRLRVRRSPAGPVPISREVARRLARNRPGTLDVALEDELPVGQGLGMSAAGAVATALAVGELMDRPMVERWAVAHLAELGLRGGLGGVAAISGGGLEVRLRAGVPPWGLVRHRRLAASVFLLPVGPPIPSPTVLGDPSRLARIRRAGRAGLDALGPAPSGSSFQEAAAGFTRRVGLTTTAMEERLDELAEAGVPAAQAMFGHLLFGLVRPAERDRVRAAVGPGGLWARVGATGARLAPAR